MWCSHLRCPVTTTCESAADAVSSAWAAAARADDNSNIEIAVGFDTAWYSGKIQRMQTLQLQRGESYHVACESTI